MTNWIDKNYELSYAIIDRKLIFRSTLFFTTRVYTHPTRINRGSINQRPYIREQRAFSCKLSALRIPLSALRNFHSAHSRIFFYMHNFDIEEKNKFFIFLQISSFPISHWLTLDLFTLSFETQFFPKKPLQNRFAPFPFYPFLFGSGEFAGVEGGEEGKVEVGRIRT